MSFSLFLIRDLRLRSAFLIVLILSTFAPYLCTAGNQDDLLVVVQNGKYGYINHAGKVVIPPQYIWAEDFWRGLGTVYACGRYLSIDSSGILHPLRIAVEGALEPQRQGAKIGFVDSNGRFIVGPTFDDALPFSDGLAAVKVGKKWGFIDSAGRQVIPLQFEAAFYFHEGVGLVELNGGYALIDKSGNALVSGLEYVDLIADGRVPVSREGKSGFLDLKGKTVILLTYESVRSFSGGLAAAEKDDKWGYIDRNGNVMIPFLFDDAGPFSAGLAPTKMGAKTGFINTTGKYAFYLPFRQAPGFLTSNGDGLFIAESDVSRFWTEDEQFGYVNKNGRVIWGPTVGSPDHPPLLGWSDEAKADSCQNIPDAIRKQIAAFPPSK